MYTGIVQAVVPVVKLEQHPSHTQITLRFPARLLQDLTIGASVALDGCCMSVVTIDGDLVSFDATRATQEIANSGDRKVGDGVNIERSAKMGDEISGHPMSGHVSATAVITGIETQGERNYVAFKVPEPWRKYIFPKGFLGLNGCSLTVAEIDATGAYRINLIPETIRQTSFAHYRPGDRLNFEVETQTMIIVDTLERCLTGYRLAPAA